MVAWSFSRLTDFEACPYRFQLKYIDKLPEAPNPHTNRGTEIHKQYERRVTHNEPTPSTFFGPMLTNLLADALTYSVETEWAFTKQWEPCSWFDKDAWVRIKPDLHLTFPTYNHIIDYKTGGIKPIQHASQGQLYAIASYLLYPTTETKTSFWYHDHDKKQDAVYTDRQIPPLQKQWTKRAQKLETDRFMPKPSTWNCRYCGMAPHCGYKAL